MLGLFATRKFAGTFAQSGASLRAFESTLSTTAESAAAKAAAEGPKLVKYPYFVRRTRFQSLPVYRDTKNGKTRKLTVIRRVEGDLEALRTDLIQALGEDSQIAIKKISQQLVIKGDCTRGIREWLTKKGF
ncbi:mitochondrial 54S ribosomal protein img2 [Coemansia interrupta]|uniref:Large ribosomal subunit protein mL49 n=1 Tax=Coemansia interrupta TaxID=1126814 RepID=A0A9W8HM31_9FUNG|nr:mitochondrial 54S ribosomal protein img2 [Coemansia interrupta]